MSGSSDSYSVTVTYIVKNDTTIHTDGLGTGQPPCIVAGGSGSGGVLDAITLDWHNLAGATAAQILTMRQQLATAAMYHTFFEVNLENTIAPAPAPG